MLIILFIESKNRNMLPVISGNIFSQPFQLLPNRQFHWPISGGDFMIMLNQPFHGQLGELLCEKLGQPLENTACFTMFSAFAKNGDVLRLKPSKRFKNAGGYIRRKNSTVPRSRNKRNGVICRSTSRRLPRSIKLLYQYTPSGEGGLCVCLRSAAPDSVPLPVPPAHTNLQKHPGRDKSIPIVQTAQQNLRHLFSIFILIKILYIVFSVDKTDLSLYTESQRQP